MWFTRLFYTIVPMTFFLSVGGQNSKNEADYRLPTNVDSVSYKITIQPDLKSSTFTARMEFVFQTLATSSVLIMNAKDLTFVEGSFKIYLRGVELPVEVVEEDKTLERVYVKPMNAFEKGETYELCVDYSGLIYDEGFGLYSNSYKDKNGITEKMLVSQLRPVHARRVFPCLDEPKFRAHFTIKIAHPPDLKPVSNMPVRTFINLKSGLILTEFEQTPPIPAFLIALILSKLPETRGKGGFYGMATPDNLEGIKYSAEIGPKLAAAMQAVSNIVYPLNKTHQVALPKLVPVAMENWGLYNFQEKNILYFEGDSPTLQKQTAARYSGHEVCHAWMGNMVSLVWWDYLWVSEVFAMYYEYLLPHMVDECWRMDEQMVIDLHQSGLLDDSVPTAPLTTEVLTPTEISNKFSGVTYTKGPGILRMAMHILGHEKYLLGFQKFLLDFAYKSAASPDTLWTYLSTYASGLPADLPEIMSEWTTTSGYPVVNVAVLEKKIVLSQSKFALDEEEKSNTTWWIPLTYTTKSECDFANTKPKKWFTPSKTMITIGEEVDQEDWILFNVQSSGFYRVNYDLGNWGRLTVQLYEDHQKIIPLNRAQLIDDGLNLARAGRLPYQTALSLAGYLAHEVDFIPWRSAVKAFSHLRTALLNSGVEHYLNRYLAGLVSTAFETLGWDEKSCDDHTAKVNREEIVRLACESDLKSCIDRSVSYVQSLIEGRPQRISVDVKQTALCTAVRVGDEDVWSAVKGWYENAANPRESKVFLDALACRSNSLSINRFFLDSLPNTSVTEWNARFSVFASKRKNAKLLFQMMNDHRNFVEEKIGKSSFSSNLKSISRFLTTEKEFKMLENLSASGVTGLENSLDSVKKMLAWRRKFVPSIQSFLVSDTQQGLIFSD